MVVVMSGSEMRSESTATCKVVAVGSFWVRSGASSRPRIFCPVHVCTQTISFYFLQYLVALDIEKSNKVISCCERKLNCLSCNKICSQGQSGRLTTCTEI